MNFYLNSGVLGQRLTDVEDGTCEIKKVRALTLRKGFIVFQFFNDV